MLKPKRIIIHHSLTPDGSTLSWPNIQSYHVNVKGWSDVGYHAAIEKVGDRFVCLFGRPDVVPGAHTKGHNADSLGFCFVGNFDDAEPERSRLRVAARRVLAPWCIRHGITVDGIVPHWQFANYKTCPGKMFDIHKLRSIVQEEIDGLRLAR